MLGHPLEIAIATVKLVFDYGPLQCELQAGCLVSDDHLLPGQHLKMGRLLLKGLLSHISFLLKNCIDRMSLKKGIEERCLTFRDNGNNI